MKSRTGTEEKKNFSITHLSIAPNRQCGDIAKVVYAYRGICTLTHTHAKAKMIDVRLCILVGNVTRKTIDFLFINISVFNIWKSFQMLPPFLPLSQPLITLFLVFLYLLTPLQSNQGNFMCFAVFFLDHYYSQWSFGNLLIFASDVR